MAKIAKKRQKSHFWRPSKIFILLQPHFLRARAAILTKFFSMCNKAMFKSTTSYHAQNDFESDSKTRHEKLH